MNPENHLIDLHEAREDKNDRCDQEESTFDKSDFLMNAFGIFLDTVDEQKGLSFFTHGDEKYAHMLSVYDKYSNPIYCENLNDLTGNERQLEKFRNKLSKYLKKD